MYPNHRHYRIGVVALASLLMLGLSHPAKAHETDQYTLPPGRERLSTNPLPTGLPTLTNTMGTVDVWRFAANDALVPKGINSLAPRCIRPLTA